jgi:hypothetical protein
LVPEARWHDWSLELLTQLEKFSSKTVGKVTFAQELMLLEVRQRQQSASAKYKNVAEILLGDLERINWDLAQNPLQTTASDDFGDVDEGEDEGDDDDEEEDQERAEDGEDENGSQLGDTGSQLAATENGRNGQLDAEMGSDQQGIKKEVNETDISMNLTDEGMGALPRSQSVRSNRVSKSSSRAKTVAQTAKLKKDLEDKAKIANLFAEAMRLRQEAAKREAEAYELEAKILMVDAKQLERARAIILACTYGELARLA